MSTDTHVGGEEKIGNYKYVRTLLNGQNSTVMEVVQDNTGKRFAMKQMLSSRAENKDERKIFELEAKLGMELRHPNLIRVYDFVRDRHQPYFVMEYFPSQHLRLALGKRDLYEQIKPKLHRIITQAAAGLAYMHDRGWVHRDIKPENMIYNKTAELRVIDYALALKVKFGLAKMFASKPPCAGTHSYMSPEQIRQLPVALTADIYSFGITCYELACGRQPFRANSANELLNKHLTEMPSPPTAHNKEITQEFSDLVMKMIKKKPADRPQSLHEFMSLFSRARIYKTDPMPGSE
ncbi:MAG: serine/threonine protein kinase [Planctomycetota bacterium]|nr:serine/threonine protein kinase [Planctomycetota bacterium]